MALAQRLALATLTAVALALLVLSGEAILGRNQKGESVALLAAALILLLGAGGIVLWRRRPAELPPLRLVAGVVTLQWLCLAALPLFAFAPNGWDEDAYLLSGLAIRGYPTPYASHRPPMTSLLCALFAPSPRWMNFVLLLALAGLVGGWARSLWSGRDATCILLMLGCQDLVVSSFIDLMPELPTAIAFTAIFYFIARGRPFLAGTAMAASVLGRWNMAIAILPILLVVRLRSSGAAAARMALGCAAPLAVWCAATSAAGYAPIADVLGHFERAQHYADTGSPVPTLLLRAAAYLPRSFFLTPLGLLSLLCSPFVPVRCRDDEVYRWHAPIAVASVVVSLLFVGAIEPRFFAPVIPVVVLVTWSVTRRILAASSLSLGSAGLVAWLVVIVVAAGGVWPGRAAGLLKQNVIYQRPISEGLAGAVTHEVEPREALALTSVVPLTTNNGMAVMYLTRRNVNFPGSERDARGNIIADPDGTRALRALVAAVAANTPIVAPREVCRDGASCRSLDVKAGDDFWVLGRSTARPRKQWPCRDSELARQATVRARGDHEPVHPRPSVPGADEPVSAPFPAVACASQRTRCETTTPTGQSG